MIGLLPKSLIVNGIARPINSDYRVVLLIFEANVDVELSQTEKIAILIELLYDCKIDECDIEEAVKEAVWFLDGGDSYDEARSNKPLFDWKQDEKMIFSAVNSVAQREVRADEYLHWWTFLSYFQAIGESAFSNVLNIRSKKAKGKKLEKYEQEYYREHKKLIDIQQRYTKEEQEEIDRLKRLLR